MTGSPSENGRVRATVATTAVIRQAQPPRAEIVCRAVSTGKSECGRARLSRERSLMPPEQPPKSSRQPSSLGSELCEVRTMR